MVEGVTEEITGALAELTVKFDALVAVVCPATSTVIGPVVAPVGTVAVIDVAVEAVTVAVVPLNLTVGEAKFDPVIVTLVPTVPELGLNPLIVGPPEEELGITSPQVDPYRIAPTFNVGAFAAVPCLKATPSIPA